MLCESGFTHGVLLRGYNPYVGRSLKMNGSVKRDTYTLFTPLLHNRNEEIVWATSEKLSRWRLYQSTCVHIYINIYQ
ncbi:hypothetical protein FS592_10730 [Serratia plymuthica]|nr:hypothetical protein FS592_10730 [Serratia plymuthica]